MTARRAHPPTAMPAATPTERLLLLVVAWPEGWGAETVLVVGEGLDGVEDEEEA